MTRWVHVRYMLLGELAVEGREAAQLEDWVEPLLGDLLAPVPRAG